MKKFIGGMVKDPERVDQPEGSYRDALNANLYYRKGTVVNEQGTTAFTNVGNFDINNIIGQCPLKDGRIVLFFNYVNKDSQATSAISIADPATLQNEILYENAQLNFQPSNTIEATSKIDVNGNILVYFTDNYLVRTTEPVTGIEYISDFNPPRVINITRQLASTSNVRLYDNDDYDIDKLDIFMNAGEIPEFVGIKIEEGGGVVSGTYHLALAYVDEDLNRTNYLVTSNPVHVVTEHEDAIPTETITGDPQGSQSNKSIIWTVDIPLPSNYTHVRPVIIQRFGGGINQSSSEFAYELEIVKIPEVDADIASVEITYTGLEQVSGASISEVVVDSVRYETAKTFVQLDNRLYMSNLRARGDIGYQRFANSIVTTPISTAVDRFDPKRFKSRVLNHGYSSINFPDVNDDFDSYNNWQSDNLGDGFFGSNVRKGYKDVNMSYNYRGYRRSEVYAFYISFILNDGSETYAYHIPGRSSLNLPRAESGGTTVNEDSLLSSTVLSSVDNALNLNLEEFADLYPDAKLYQVTDTQFILNEAGSRMSFWENEDERYPDTEDFDRYTVNDTGDIISTGDIRDRRVRHHKMPPNKNLTHSFVNPMNGGAGVNLSLFGDPTSYSGLALDEEVKILGVRFSNIPMPQFIRDQVQGFKIYYAKRTQQEKSIIGQSVVVPAWYEEPIAVTNRMTNAAHGPYSDAWFLRGQPVAYDNAILKSDIPGKVNRLKAFSVFTFHDFNLLKNKHTLSGASHVDVQKILTMRAWAGGNNKKPRNVSESYLKYIIDTDWVNSTIGNETWYEWVDNGSGTYNTEEAPGATDSKADPRGVANYYTSVLIAQRYNNPNYLNNPQAEGTYNVADGEVYGYWLNNYRTHAMISPNSKSYITGSTLLKNTDSSAFKNADYLMHFAGESCMVFGLVSGLPALLQHAHKDVSVTTNPINWWNDAVWASVENPDDGHILKDLSVTAGSNNFMAWPALFLVNLCVYKNNVYKPFDQQKLVWTGYYQKLQGNKNIEATNTVYGGDTYISRHSFRTTSQDYGAMFRLGNGPYGNANADNWSGVPFALYSVNGQDKTQLKRTVDPYATVFNFLCESDDLLGFRHQGDNEAGVTVAQSLFWDASIAADVLFGDPSNDYTKSDHLLYMNNYSAVQDIKTTVPLPKKLFNPTFYPTRTIRSTVDDGSIQDKYRFFLALDYKDIPRNRGEITKLFTLGSILYLHTERSLFVTRGRQQLGLSDNTQAFVGSGDIFEQNPDEMIPTTEGYGGTDCQFASLTTRFGQFFVNRKDRKVYMMGESIQELSSLGMEKWFLENIPYELESYINLEEVANFDAPTEFFGFTATYDPKYKRIILSKRERIPDVALIAQMNGSISDVQAIDGGFSFYNERLRDTVEVQFSDLAEGGWTVSYYPELKVWGSRHSYLPVIFANNQQEYYGLTNGADGNVWEHSNLNAPGNYYGNQYNFEFEYIDNTQAGLSKVFSNIRYWAEVMSLDGVYPTQVEKHTSPAFTQFYTYNSTQISDTRDIYYLTNARLVDRFWYINDFRDLSEQVNNNAAVVANNQLNVHDLFNDGTVTSRTDVPMFTEEGVINAAYINPNKNWYNQKKFVDHFLGVRLISDNLTGNLIHLYAAGTKFRQSFR